MAQGLYRFVVTPEDMDYVERRTIKVWGQGKEVTRDHIEELFVQIGPVVHVDFRIKKMLESTDNENQERRSPDNAKGFCSGFDEDNRWDAWVEFEHEESIQFACEIMNGLKLFANKISVIPLITMGIMSKIVDETPRREGEAPRLTKLAAVPMCMKWKAPKENGEMSFEEMEEQCSFERFLEETKMTNEEKQKHWLEFVDLTVRNIHPDNPLYQAVQRLSTNMTVPRKENKFINFMKHSCGIDDEIMAHKVWWLINQEAHKTLKPSTNHTSKQIPVQRREGSKKYIENYSDNGLVSRNSLASYFQRSKKIGFVSSNHSKESEKMSRLKSIDVDEQPTKIETIDERNKARLTGKSFQIKGLPTRQLRTSQEVMESEIAAKEAELQKLKAELAELNKTKEDKVKSHVQSKESPSFRHNKPGFVKEFAKSYESSTSMQKVVHPLFKASNQIDDPHKPVEKESSEGPKGLQTSVAKSDFLYNDNWEPHDWPGRGQRDYHQAHIVPKPLYIIPKEVDQPTLIQDDISTLKAISHIEDKLVHDKLCCYSDEERMRRLKEYIVLLKVQLAKYKCELIADPTDPDQPVMAERDLSEVFKLATEELESTYEDDCFDDPNEFVGDCRSTVALNTTYGKLIILRQRFENRSAHDEFALRAALDTLLQPSTYPRHIGKETYELWLEWSNQGPKDCYPEFLKRALHRASVLFRKDQKKYEKYRKSHAQKVNKFMEFLNHNKEKYQKQAGRKLNLDELRSFASAEWNPMPKCEKDKWKFGNPTRFDKIPTYDPFTTLHHLLRHVGLRLNQEYAIGEGGKTRVILKLGHIELWHKDVHVHRDKTVRRRTAEEIAHNILKKFVGPTSLYVKDEYGNGFYISW